MKNKALYDLLLDLPPCRTLIFVNSWQKADIVDDFLFNMVSILATA
jgi:ATP-dependent RNA helicase DDX3X